MPKYKETNTLMHISNVNLAFGPHLILDNINLEIKDIVEPGKVRGQIRCILGPSGVGKTLLFRIMAGLLEPDSGEVLIAADGETLHPVKAGDVGVVGQHYPLFEHLSVLDNLILGGKTAGLSKAEAKDKSMELLDRFGLANWFNFWPKQLSGGQRQRIAILQQVMVKRMFIIMDEPFSGLDPKALHKVIELIRELAASHEFQTILFTTHDISAGVQVADFVHILGREFNAAGEVVRPGHFLEHMNLIDQGIAWQSNIRELASFQRLINTLEDKFDNI
ncbi:MAG: ATP-binding cassette domain-containing protein [Leptospirales bacterium]